VVARLRETEPVGAISQRLEKMAPQVRPAAGEPPHDISGGISLSSKTSSTSTILASPGTVVENSVHAFAT
jgi:hypothetical protein